MTPEEKIEAAAKAIYELDPHEEGGEYVDGFQVSPGGLLSWSSAKERDAEFGDDPVMGRITEFAYNAARAAFKAFMEVQDAIDGKRREDPRQSGEKLRGEKR